MTFMVDFDESDDLEISGLADCLTPADYAWSSVGGPEDALLVGELGAHAVSALPRLLGKDVRIWDERALKVWWGKVMWVDLGTARYSLEEMTNRVCVRYQGGLTDWVKNDESIVDYGAKERIFPVLTTSQSAAQAARDAFLAVHAFPHGEVSHSDRQLLDLRHDPHQKVAVQVGCKGWWNTLSWEYYGFPLRSVVSLGAFPDSWQTFGKRSTDYRIAQAFTIPTGEIWTLRQIRCTMRTRGKPGDRVVARLCQDDSGVPGAVVASGTLSGDALTNTGGSVTISFSSPVPLSGGSYWIVWNRTGALLLGEAYELGFLSSSGTYALYVNGAWNTQSGTVTLDVLGGQHLPSETLIPRVAVDAGQFLEDVQLVGLRSPDIDLPQTPFVDEYEDGSRTGLAVLNSLLAYGTRDGRRLLARVTPERVLRVFPAPVAEISPMRMGLNGCLYEGEMPLLKSDLGRMVGRWVLPEDPYGTGIEPIFIDGARYDVKHDRLHLDSRTAGEDLGELAKILGVWGE